MIKILNKKFNPRLKARIRKNRQVINYEDDYVEIRLDDLEAKAREYEIHDLSQFYKSSASKGHNFTIDAKRKIIRHSI